MKNKGIILQVLALFITCITGTSCIKEKLEATYNSQESKIDTYVEKATDCRIVRNGGSNRIVRTEGEGEELRADGSVSFYYAGYTFNGSISASSMFATNRQATAEEAGWNLTDADYGIFEVSLKDTELLEGLRNGLTGVKAGEECEILFSGKYGFGKKTFGTIPAKSALLYKVWVVAVSND